MRRCAWALSVTLLAIFVTLAFEKMRRIPLHCFAFLLSVAACAADESPTNSNPKQLLLLDRPCQPCTLRRIFDVRELVARGIAVDLLELVHGVGSRTDTLASRDRTSNHRRR